MKKLIFAAVWRACGVRLMRLLLFMTVETDENGISAYSFRWLNLNSDGTLMIGENYITILVGMPVAGCCH